MKNNKILSVFIMLVLLLGILSINTYAIDYRYGVYDEADLLTAEEEHKLTAMASDWAKSLRAHIIFLTVDDAGRKSSAQVADNFYDELIYGSAGGPDEDGILFLIDMDNREVYVSTSGNLICWINDQEIDDAIDKGWTDLTKGNYYDSFNKIAKEALNTAQYWKSQGDTCDDDAYIKGPGSTYGQRQQKPTFFSAFTSGFLRYLLLGIIAAVGFAILSLKKHNAPNKKMSANLYLSENQNYKVTNKDVKLVKTWHTVDKGYYAPKNNSSSSGHRSGSSHSSSSGRSHGGGGRKF